VYLSGPWENILNVIAVLDVNYIALDYK